MFITIKVLYICNVKQKQNKMTYSEFIQEKVNKLDRVMTIADMRLAYKEWTLLQEKFEETKGYTSKVLEKFKMPENLLDDLIKINIGIEI